MNKHVLKCPSCNETLGKGLSRFCPSCGNALDVYQHQSVSNIEMEQVFENINEVISDLKKVEPTSITKVLIKHLYVTIPLLSVLICLIVFRLDFLGDGFFLLCLALGYLNFFLFVDTGDKDSSGFTLKQSFRKKNEKTNYKEIKANVEKQIQIAKIKYGTQKELGALIEEFKNETILIDQKNKRVRITETIIYLLFILGVVIFFLIPSKPRISEEEQAIEINKRLELVEDKINVFIFNEYVDSALHLINKLHHPLHLIYNGKSSWSDNVYYDEYWDKKREEYKNLIY